MTEMEVNVCFCLFVLNQCSLLASSFSGKLLYSNDTSIMEFDIDTHNLTVLVEQGSSVYGMDYDYKNRFIYFPRYNIYDIARFPYPSENRTLQTIVQTEQYPIGIAVDSANGHIYWTDISTHKLSRCVLDGTNVTIISTISNSWAIRLDVTNRWMYIAEYNLGILKSRFNLEEKQTIVSFTSGGAYCMDIDTDGNRLYWINVDGDMNSAKVDGSDVKTILSTNVRRNYYAIGVFGSQIYYANEYHQLLLVTKTPGSKPTVLYNDTSEIHSIFVFNQAAFHGKLLFSNHTSIMEFDVHTLNVTVLVETVGSLVLSRCNLDRSNVTVLSILRNPWVIRLDVKHRWMYIVELEVGILKSTFDLSEKRTIVNFTSTPVYCMDIDTEEIILYWINNNGEIQSDRDDGSDVETILWTNFTGYNFAIGVFGSYIYYADHNQLLMVTKTPGSTPTFMYNDTSSIYCIFVFNPSGMKITNYNHL
ncbi:unnamed protein product [Mytilus coruscus]|uniref:LRP5_6 n=1 Tax=Mytilus coruscus TaxID=42192 RepID=A0A6J8C1Y8_MYTCO|nr:unnamed protein product [Mytilus coruscus]